MGNQVSQLCKKCFTGSSDYINIVDAIELPYCEPPITEKSKALAEDDENPDKKQESLSQSSTDTRRRSLDEQPELSSNIYYNFPEIQQKLYQARDKFLSTIYKDLVEQNFRQVSNKDGITIYSKDEPSSFHIYYFLQRIDQRPKYDDNLDQIEMVGYKQHIQINHLIFKKQLMYASRDMITASYQDHFESKLVDITVSVESEQFPNNNGTRMLLMMGGYIVEAVPEGSNVTNLAHIDPGSGKIPITFVRSMACSKMPKFVRGLTRTMNNYYNGEGQGNVGLYQSQEAMLY